jgi:uncharacterized membrane protein
MLVYARGGKILARGRGGRRQHHGLVVYTTRGTHQRPVLVDPGLTGAARGAGPCVTVGSAQGMNGEGSVDDEQVRRGEAEDANALARLMALSEGVFAVAITLLVFELTVPSVHADTLGSALAARLPAFGAFVLSFWILGLYWLDHHRVFRRVVRFADGLLWLNLLFLFCIVFLPFPTALLGRYPSTRIGVILYAASLAATGLVWTGLLWYVVGRRLVQASIDPRLRRYWRWNALVAPAVCGVVIMLAVAHVTTAGRLLFVIFPLQLLADRFGRPRPQARG